MLIVESTDFICDHQLYEDYQYENGGCRNLNQSCDSAFELVTDRLYKIWFNREPDLFLTEENKLRLEKLRSDNPDSQISLVYSGGLVDPAIEQEAEGFLNGYNISAVDFDVILDEARSGNKIPEMELRLLMLAKEELDNLGDRGNGGGNFAAASDILRFCPSIARFGIYSDFDVHLEFRDIVPLFKVSSPIIIPSQNNDFIAFARGCDGQEMHPDALREVHKIQHGILKRYQGYDSVTAYRAQIKSRSIYDELESIFKNHKSIVVDEYSDIDAGKLTARLDLLESAKALPEAEAEKLFCDIQSDFTYYLYKDFYKLGREALNSVFEYIRDNVDHYEIADESIKYQISNFKDLKEIDKELLLVKLGRIYNKNVFSEEVTSHYCHLAVKIYVFAGKYHEYKSSVMFNSGPEVLSALYNMTYRGSLSPKANKIPGIINGPQDGSWYIRSV